MAKIKTQEEREIAELRQVEERIRHSERRERIHHVLIAGLGILLVASLLTGHLCPKCRRR